MITIVVLLPFFVEDFLHVKPDWYGFLVAAFGGGSFLGAILVGVTKVKGSLRTWSYLVFALGFGFAAIGLGLARSPWMAMALIFVAGVMSGFNTIQVLKAPPSSPRRASCAARAGDPRDPRAQQHSRLPPPPAGIVADLLHRNIPLVYFGCGGALIVVAFVQAAKREVREFLAYEPAAADLIQEE